MTADTLCLLAAGIFFASGLLTGLWKYLCIARSEAGLPLLFFGSAIAIYIVHGLLRDTDNQLRSPHKLGAMTLPAVGVHGFMWLLAVAEIGGFSVLLYGFLISL